MKRKRFGIVEKEPFKWEAWTNLCIQIILVLITVFSFCETQKSTKTAQDALALQRSETIESQRKDSLNSIQDSIKNEKFIALAEQQILALKDQASVLNIDVKNKEISQKPYFVVRDFGFHKLGKEDIYEWSLKIQNYGERPAYSKVTKFYFFNDKFELTGKSKVELTTLAYKDFVVIHEIKPFLNGVEFSNLTKKDILTIDNSYVAFLISYYDPLLKKNIFSNEEIQSFKWAKKSESQLYYRKVGEDLYFYFDRCNDYETSKILETLNKIKE